MKNILGGYMLFWKPEGPQLEYRQHAFFIADLNPEIEIQWRMSRWELFIIGCKCVAAAIRALKDKSHVLPIVHNGDGWIVDDAKRAVDPNLVYPGKDLDFVFPEEN